MMAMIYKYPLAPGHTELRMPKGAQVLTVQLQNGNPCMWVKVDPGAEQEDRAFDVYGTGHDMPDDPRMIYVGTFQMDRGALVWHVFDSTYAA